MTGSGLSVDLAVDAGSGLRASVVDAEAAGRSVDFGFAAGQFEGGCPLFGWALMQKDLTAPRPAFQFLTLTPLEGNCVGG